MAGTNLASSFGLIEQRVHASRSTKIKVVTSGDTVLGEMNRPMDMTHEDFLKKFNEMIKDFSDREIASMSAQRKPGRRQNLDDAPCTLSIKVH